jgi:hypothetical protein
MSGYNELSNTLPNTDSSPKTQKGHHNFHFIRSSALSLFFLWCGTTKQSVFDPTCVRQQHSRTKDTAAYCRVPSFRLLHIHIFFTMTMMIMMMMMMRHPSSSAGSCHDDNVSRRSMTQPLLVVVSGSSEEQPPPTTSFDPDIHRSNNNSNNKYCRLHLQVQFKLYLLGLLCGGMVQLASFLACKTLAARAASFGGIPLTPLTVSQPPTITTTVLHVRDALFHRLLEIASHLDVILLVVVWMFLGVLLIFQARRGGRGGGGSNQQQSAKRHRSCDTVTTKLLFVALGYVYGGILGGSYLMFTVFHAVVLESPAPICSLLAWGAITFVPCVYFSPTIMDDDEEEEEDSYRNRSIREGLETGEDEMKV